VPARATTSRYNHYKQLINNILPVFFSLKNQRIYPGYAVSDHDM